MLSRNMGKCQGVCGHLYLTRYFYEAISFETVPLIVYGGLYGNGELSNLNESHVCLDSLESTKGVFGQMPEKIPNFLILLKPLDAEIGPYSAVYHWKTCLIPNNFSK